MNKKIKECDRCQREKDEYDGPLFCFDCVLDWVNIINRNLDEDWTYNMTRNLDEESMKQINNNVDKYINGEYEANTKKSSQKIK